MKRFLCVLIMLCLLGVSHLAGAEGYRLIEVEPIEQRPAAAANALIQRFEGEMTGKGQTDVYHLVVPEDGRIRLEMSELYDYAKVDLRVYNQLRECVAEKGYAGNGDGITLKNMKAGEEYDIHVTQREKLSKYILSVGMPKAALDISEITRLDDSMEYTDQRNTYTLTVRRDGRVRLEACEMMAGTVISVRVRDRLNQDVQSDDYCLNGEGVTLTGLKAGETYTVHVDQREGLGGYTLLIGQQKETVTCETGTVIADSVEYTDQRNVYMVTVREDGNLTATLQEMTADNVVVIRIYNRLMEEVCKDGYAVNGDSCVLQGVKAGEEYQVQVLHHTGFCGYQLQID